MKLKKLLPLLLAFCLLLAACGTSEDAGNDDAVITLAEPSAELTPGETCKIGYTVEPQDAKITFSSSDADIASVAADGTVTAVGNGSTVIAVSAGEYSKAYFEVTVKAASMQPVPNLLLSNTSLELIAGSTYDITASVKDGTELLDGCTVNWESSDAAVAVVENGKVTAKAEGDAVITASAEIDGNTTVKTCEVHVYPFYKLTLSQDIVRASVGAEFTLDAQITAADGSAVTPAAGELELVTSDSDSVQVTENNTFKVVNIGNTGVGVRYKGNTAMIPVDIFSVTADFFSDSCTDFYGEVAGETVCAVKFTSSVYQPRIYLTEEGIARLNAYAEENGFDSVTIRAYSILMDNAFVIGNKYWLPNGAWGETKIKLSELTPELDFWSQSQGTTEIYMTFMFK